MLDGHAVGRKKAVVNDQTAVGQLGFCAHGVQGVGVDDDQLPQFHRDALCTAKHIAPAGGALKDLNVFVPVGGFLNLLQRKNGVVNKGKQGIGHIVGFVASGHDKPPNSKIVLMYSKIAHCKSAKINIK